MHYLNKIESGKNISLRYYAGRIVWTVFRWYFLISIAFVILYPLMYMLTMAFRSPQDFLDVTVVWIPKHFTFDNFKRVLWDMGLLEPLANTAIISVLSTACQILVTAMTGYGFARYQFRGNTFLFILAVVAIMMPTQMINLPNYLVMKNMDFFGLFQIIAGKPSPINLLNSPLAFIVPAALGQGFMSGLFILIFRQFFSNMPVELEEAATIDGCGHGKLFWLVMLPNAGTALVICSIFSITWYWTDYQGPFIFLTTLRTIAVELMDFNSLASKVLDQSQQSVHYIMPMQQAACIVAILPILILFLISQRFFAKSVERSGIVG